MPDFIALRGDPSDKIPGAPGVGPKKAADVLKQHGSLAQALADGRFSQIADELLLYRDIATMDDRRRCRSWRPRRRTGSAPPSTPASSVSTASQSAFSNASDYAAARWTTG